MKRALIIAAVGAFALLVYWIASNTEWTDVQFPMPLQGEARTNPFYAAQRFTEQLHAHATRDSAFTSPSTNAVIVLSAWNWNLSTARREALERWVESGGRLVVDRTLIGDERDFERWSHVTREPHALDKRDEAAFDDPCARFDEARHGTKAGTSGAASYWMCDVDRKSSLVSERKAEWALRNESRVQAMRVPVGRGSVTVINAEPFRYTNLFDGDHAALLVAAAQLRRGDEVHFLSEEDHPSLFALAWTHGAPVVALAAALVALLLWRRGVRFGPLAPPDVSARRSLAEQILGTGRFAMRHGGGDSLHAACVRALDEAAQRRINGYARLSAAERAASLAHLTHVDEQALASAIDAEQSRSAHDLRRAIAVLETARRATIVRQRRLSYGNH